jgi:transcriptional regulator GlxA family with amidase domain
MARGYFGAYCGLRSSASSARANAIRAYQRYPCDQPGGTPSDAGTNMFLNGATTAMSDRPSLFSKPTSSSDVAVETRAGLIDWMQDNLASDLDVPSLAARAGLTERSFYRRFAAAVGTPPAQFVEMVRLEAARALMSEDLPLKAVAAKVGLTPIRLNRAFERHFGIAPRLFRDMHRQAA